MTVDCIYPERDDPEASLPDGWDEWRAGARCTHDYCIEVDGYRRTAPKTLSREEREEIESDHELMADEFHGRDLAGNIR